MGERVCRICHRPLPASAERQRKYVCGRCAPQSPKPKRTCPDCGVEHRRGGALCSRCSKVRWRAAHPEAQAAYNAARREAPPERWPKVCESCGREFAASDKRVRFCGPSCGKRLLPEEALRRKKEASRRREAKRRYTRPPRHMRGSGITHLLLAERDGWRCHLCGRKVTRENWSIDHLVPRSQGGPNTWENVKLAHHRCNSRRSTGGDVQLLLVG